jgi:hypothetical protein
VPIQEPRSHSRAIRTPNPLRSSDPSGLSYCSRNRSDPSRNEQLCPMQNIIRPGRYLQLVMGAGPAVLVVADLDVIISLAPVWRLDVRGLELNDN